MLWRSSLDFSSSVYLRLDSLAVCLIVFDRVLTRNIVSVARSAWTLSIAFDLVLAAALACGNHGLTFCLCEHIKQYVAKVFLPPGSHLVKLATS